jgi:DNA primase
LEEFIRKLNLKNVKFYAHSIRSNCIFHNDDSATLSFYIYSRRYICFSARCGAKGDFEDLEKIYGIKISKYIEPADEKVETKVIPKYRLAIYEHAYGFRGLSDDEIRKWDIRKYNDNRILIPIFNERDDLIGAAFYNAESIPRYKFTRGLPRNSLLYGMNMVISGGHKDIAIVEGMADCWNLWRHGIPAVATLGARLSNGQCKLLYENVDKVTIWYDNDDAGRNGAIEAYKKLIKVMDDTYMVRYCGQWPKDPGESDATTINRMWSQRV